MEQYIQRQSRDLIYKADTKLVSFIPFKFYFAFFVLHILQIHLSMLNVVLIFSFPGSVHHCKPKELLCKEPFGDK